jgi:hypothetical protein
MASIACELPAGPRNKRPYRDFFFADFFRLAPFFAPPAFLVALRFLATMRPPYKGFGAIQEFVVPKLRDQLRSRHNNKQTIPILGLACRAASMRCSKRHASRKYLYVFRKFVQHDFAKSSRIGAARDRPLCAQSRTCARTISRIESIATRALRRQRASRRHIVYNCSNTAPSTLRDRRCATVECASVVR